MVRRGLVLSIIRCGSMEKQCALRGDVRGNVTARVLDLLVYQNVLNECHVRNYLAQLMDYLMSLVVVEKVDDTYVNLKFERRWKGRSPMIQKVILCSHVTFPQELEVIRTEKVSDSVQFLKRFHIQELAVGSNDKLVPRCQALFITATCHRSRFADF